MSQTQAPRKPKAKTKDRSALALLKRDPYRFDFFQAVRLLSLATHAEYDATQRRSAQPIGEDYRPEDELIRFRAVVSHSFPSAVISSLDADGDQPSMEVAFMGLTGPSGVLPQHYTRDVIERVRKKDFALRDFLDLFNHRVISYFYRAWEKHNFAVSYESAVRRGRVDPYTLGLFSLIGQGTRGLRGRLDVDDGAFLYYGGHFARYPRSAVCLEATVSDFFRLSAKVLQFHGQWLHLGRTDQTSMPSSSMPLGQNNELGVTAVAGERVWSVESKFRIRIGPFGLADFKRFTPVGDRLVPLAQFVRRYVGQDLDFDVQLVLRRDEVPMCRLGGDSQMAPQLGWTTWIHNDVMDDDREDAVFSSDGMPTR